MNTPDCSISTCKHCRCFQSEGRRGGMCTQFGTFAASDWSICPLAKPIFGESWNDEANVALLEKSFVLRLSEKQHVVAIAAQNPAYPEAV